MLKASLGFDMRVELHEEERETGIMAYYVALVAVGVIIRRWYVPGDMAAELAANPAKLKEYVARKLAKLLA